VISPKTGIIEKNYYTGAFANLPRKKLLSYGKLWFGNDGRCFLLAGQEGILYELDTEKRIAYYIADLNFNSPKDALPHSALKSPEFIGNEMLALKIQVYPHMMDYLELEWYERNDKAEVAYYYCEKFNPETSAWEQIGSVAGYQANTQSNRYTQLDRAPRKGENCYRLRIEYLGGFIAYSPQVCFDKRQTVYTKAQKISLSHSIVPYNSGGTYLHLINYKQRKIRVELYQKGNNKLIKCFELLPTADDQSLWLDLERTGWYEIRVIDSMGTQSLKLFKQG
jgi:hypothetical protein